MRGLAGVGLLLALTPSAAAWPADPFPGDRLEPALLTVEYERPWPGLQIRRGAARAGLALPGGIRVGAGVSDLATPSVRETAWGGWAVLGRRLFVAADRVTVRVDGLEALRRIDGELAAELGAGPLHVGWWVRIAGLDLPVPPVWRQWWLAVRRAGIELSLGRRLTPWQVEPAWTVGLRFALAQGIESVLGWRGRESILGLRIDLPASRVTARTAWSGERAGAFGFRVQAGLP